MRAALMGAWLELGGGPASGSGKGQWSAGKARARFRARVEARARVRVRVRVGLGLGLGCCVDGRLSSLARRAKRGVQHDVAHMRRHLYRETKAVPSATLWVPVGRVLCVSV